MPLQGQGDIPLAGWTRDNTGRIRMGPASRKGFWDAVWPHRHGKWWNWNAEHGRTDTVEELMGLMRLDDRKSAQEHLDFANSVARSASDRADAADRRATTIAGAVSIAATLTLSGAALLLDHTKWGGASGLRVVFAFGLFSTTLGFVMAAVYSLRALSSKAARTWNWLDPHDMWQSLDESDEARRLGHQAARVLDHFAANWEIADFKNRNIDNALRMIFCALVSLTVLALVALLVILLT